MNNIENHTCITGASESGLSERQAIAISRIVAAPLARNRVTAAAGG